MARFICKSLDRVVVERYHSAYVTLKINYAKLLAFPIVWRSSTALLWIYLLHVPDLQSSCCCLPRLCWALSNCFLSYQLRYIHLICISVYHTSVYHFARLLAFNSYSFLFHFSFFSDSFAIGQFDIQHSMMRSFVVLSDTSAFSWKLIFWTFCYWSTVGWNVKGSTSEEITENREQHAVEEVLTAKFSVIFK